MDMNDADTFDKVIQVPQLSKLQHCVKGTSPLKIGKFCGILSGKENGTNLTNLFNFDDEFELLSKQTLCSFDNLKLNYVEYTNSRRLPSLLQTVRMDIQKLQFAARKNLFNADEYSTMRSNISSLLRAITTGVQDTDTKVTDKYLSLIRPLWQPVALTPHHRELYLSCYDSGGTEFLRGQCVASSAKFHHLHAFLEARWFYLEYLLRRTLTSDCDDQMGKLSLIDTELEAELKLYLADMITLCLISFSKAVHDRYTMFELFEQTSAFPCVCFLEVMCVCASFTHFLRHEHHFSKFSDYFLEVMTSIEENKFPEYVQTHCDRLPSRRFFARLTPETVFTQLKPEQLVIFKMNCLLRIIKVQTVDESEVIDGVRTTIQSFVKLEPGEDQFRALLLLMIDSLGSSWDTKCDLISIFFDCLYKRINTPFFMPNSRLDTLAIVDTNASAFLSEIQQSLTSTKAFSHHSTSFSILIHIIGKSLIDQRTNGQKSVSNKLLGRIFSKFNISKIVALSERGLHNFIVLIVTLAVSCDLSDFGNRLMDVLLQIHYNKLLPDRQKILVKGHLSLLMLFADQKLHYGKHIERLVNQLKENVADQSSLWELFALSTKEILAKRAYFEDGGHLFIGTWIRPYINVCNENEKRDIFMAIKDILENVLNVTEITGSRHNIIKAMFDYVLPIIKQFYLKKSEVNNLRVSEIAAKLTSLAKGTDGLPSFDAMLSFFGDVMRPNVPNVLEYYTSLTNSDLAKVSTEVLIQNWIKFENLSQLLSQEQLVFMRDTVLAVPDVRSFVAENVENIKKVNFGGPAPLLFFKAMFEKYYKMDNYNNKLSLVKTAERYLNNFTKWAVIYLESTNLFRFTASLLKYCAPMLYSKMNHSCIFNQIFGQLVLPQEIMIMKQPSLALCKNMAVSFPDFCVTLTKMNFKQDPGLLDKFNNLISKWTFILAKADTDMTCARKAYILLCRNGDDETVRVTIKIFSEYFLKMKVVTPENLNIGAQIFKIVYFEVLKLDEIKVCAVLSGGMDEILEQIIEYDENVSSKRILFELLKDMLCKERVSTFKGIESVFIESLKNLTDKKKLLHYKTQFFVFLQRLTKINMNLIENFLPYLNESIEDIESVLGKNNCVGLRGSQEVLIKMISASKK